jgi:hypothetical protein
MSDELAFDSKDFKSSFRRRRRRRILSSLNPDLESLSGSRRDGDHRDDHARLVPFRSGAAGKRERVVLMPEKAWVFRSDVSFFFVMFRSDVAR